MVRKDEEERMQEKTKDSRWNEEGSMIKDSRRSWLVCLGACFLVGCSIGMSNCFGVLFVSWTREFQERRTKIGKRSVLILIALVPPLVVNWIKGSHTLPLQGEHFRTD